MAESANKSWWAELAFGFRPILATHNNNNTTRVVDQFLIKQEMFPISCKRTCIPTNVRLSVSIVFLIGSFVKPKICQLQKQQKMPKRFVNIFMLHFVDDHFITCWFKSGCSYCCNKDVLYLLSSQDYKPVSCMMMRLSSPRRSESESESMRLHPGDTRYVSCITQYTVDRTLRYSLHVFLCGMEWDGMTRRNWAFLPSQAAAELL